MAHDTHRQNQTKPVSRLQRISRGIAFSDYEQAHYLQNILTQELHPKSEGHIEAAILQRSANIRLWYNIIPLFAGFIPLWLLWVIPLFRMQLSSVQIMAIMAAILLSGLCYLITFRNDGLRFQSNLAYVRKNLLAAFQIEQKPLQLPIIVPSAQQDIIRLTPTPKGSVRLLLLNELVKKEAGYANIFNAPIDEVIPFYKKLVGLNEKNFKKTMQQYRRRQDIVLDQENARTTHQGYLDVIIRYYNAIGEAHLERQAIVLQSFLNQTVLQVEGQAK